MNADFQYRDKIPVVILGATGTVGQRFITLLARHPWFEIAALMGSERTAGKVYQETVHWVQTSPLDPDIGKMTILPMHPSNNPTIAFSALDSSVAGTIETTFAEAGYLVVSNASNHRMDADVPLLIPEVNPHHTDLLKQQTTKGKIVTNPNCIVTGLTITLKPLQEKYGLKHVHAVTFQSVSGAGYPGVPSLDILDNILPHISGEEDKICAEPQKILDDRSFCTTVQCNRVPVSEGHLICVSATLTHEATEQEIISLWIEYRGLPQEWQLPTAPIQPIHYRPDSHFPQPKYHRDLEKGMGVSIGQLKLHNPTTVQFTTLSHNTIRGAAGGAILNAELLVKKGFVYW